MWRRGLFRIGKESLGEKVTVRQRDGAIVRGRHVHVAAPFLAAAILISLASCATIPERPSPQWLGALPHDSTLFISLSVAPLAAAIKDSLKNAGPTFSDLGPIVDMTKRFYFGVTLIPDQAPKFSAIGLGSYPSTYLGWRLGSSGDWKAQSSSSGSWHERVKGGLQISAPSNSVFLFSNGGMEALLPQMREPRDLPLPPEVVLDLEQSDIVLYMPELPGGIAERTAGDISIPIHEVWLDARKGGIGFEVGGTLNLSTEREAKLFAMVVRLAIVAWLRSEKIADAGERLQTVAVTPQGNQVVLTGLSFTEAEIVPVLMSLLLGGIAPAEPGS